MLEEDIYLDAKPRRAHRFQFKFPIGTVLCSLAIGYVLTAALVGLLAG